MQIITIGEPAINGDSSQPMIPFARRLEKTSRISRIVTNHNLWNLSSHLAKLEAANYVKIEKTYRGKIPLTICRLTPAGRTAFKQYRAALKASL